MKKRILTAGLLAALGGSGVYAVTQYSHSTAATETAPRKPFKISLPDISSAEEVVAASKKRLQWKLDDERHPNHAKAKEFIGKSEEAVNKLRSLSEAVAAISTNPDPAAATQSIEQYERTVEAVEKVREQAQDVDPESKSFWDKLLDSLLWILNNVLLPLFADWLKGKVTGGDPSSTSGKQSGGGSSYTLADSTLAGVSNGGQLMLAGGSQAISLKPPGEGRVVGLLDGKVGTFPLIVEWQRPDGSRADYEYASERSDPAIRHGK